MKTFGLIGKELGHSYSQQYFQKKFLKEGLVTSQYLNFEMDDLNRLRELIKEYSLKGLNVTIPYKEEIISFLDKISKEARAVGAVNTIEIKNRKLIGHNTDIFGFEKSFLQISKKRKKAIVLGNGGASKAVQYVFRKNNIDYLVANRYSNFTIEKIDKDILEEYNIIVNATPLGMYPENSSFPNLPYDLIDSKHLLFDLVYNPDESLFLAKGKANGSEIKNGKEMLHLQAEESWRIWN